ncbi:MAG: MBL fold metallo-hydrolase [Desulfosporosinus sp.]|nr:MBL fold metallo-hydrolase [Desulfosporosinus sp.]
MLVTDGVHMIEGVKGAHSYLVTGSHLILVDTGLPGQEHQICNYLSAIGIDPATIEGIVLTHFDVDHVGSVVAMQRFSKCPIYAHALEIPYIQGQKKRLGIKQWLPMVTRPVCGKLIPPTDLRPLVDGELFEEWEIIHTPGHTPGHITLYRNGIAIVGDLFQGGEIRLAPSYLTWNADKLKESAQAVIERPLRWILPGHGPATPAASHWLDKLQKTLRSRSR